MDWRHHSLTLAAGLAMVFAGCAREIDYTDPNSFPKRVEAQFDPTHRIPVLRLVPSPTVLAQRGADDYRINYDAVKPEACEGPDPAQCLQFADGWPTTVNPTLYFSGDLDEKTISEGIMWVDLTHGLPLTFTASVSPRPAPPEACETVEGMSYTKADIPPGIQVVLKPTQPLRHATQYAIWVKSSTTGGLKDTNGNTIEPSALFSLLNQNEPALAPDGEVLSAVLRSQVQTTVASADPDMAGKQWAELTPEQQERLKAGTTQTGKLLAKVSELVRTLVHGALNKGWVEDRHEVVFANMWTTGPAPVEAMFDTTNSILPIPNDHLLMVRDATSGALDHVKLPVEGQTGSTLALLTALNQLDGFSTLGPISIPFSRPLDPSVLTNDYFRMYEVTGEGKEAKAGDEVPLHVVQTRTSTASERVTVNLIPTAGLWPDAAQNNRPRLLRYPLKPKTTYVVAVVKEGLKDVEGHDVVAPATYAILSAPMPLDQLIATPAGAPTKEKLRCAVYQSSGKIPDDDALMAYVQAKIEARNVDGGETGLDRPSWEPVFAALKNRDAEMTPDKYVMAFNYTTQTLNKEVNAGKQLIAGLGQDPDWVTKVETINNIITSPIAHGPNDMDRFLRFTETVCGAAGYGRNAPECNALRAVFTGAIASTTDYTMKSFDLTTGNPYASGAITREGLTHPRPAKRRVLVTVPRVPPFESVPEGGWPVVIFQHGLTSEALKVSLIANSFAKAGFATIAMDLPFHGTRVSDVQNNKTGRPCMDVDPAQIKCKPRDRNATASYDKKGNLIYDCENGCDGIGDPSGTGFLSPNAFGVRGNFQQAAIDQLNLLEAIRAGKFTDLSKTTIHYVGQSLGGITGSSLLSWATHDGTQPISKAVLNVPGGSLIDILMNAGPDIARPLLGALAEAGVCVPNDPDDITKGCQETERFAQFKAFAQWGVDAGDPLALTQIGHFNGENILVQMVTGDPIVTNFSTEMLVRAHKIPPGNHVKYTFDYPTNCHGFLLDLGCSRGSRCAKAGICETLKAQKQAADFLVTGKANGPNAYPEDLPGIVADCANPCN